MNDRGYQFFTYIAASRSRQLYVGMTNNIRGRIWQHRQGKVDSYTARYCIHRLVYYEESRYVLNAIDRENQWKSWTRDKKVELIERVNPTWVDLAEEWFTERAPRAGGATRWDRLK